MRARSAGFASVVDIGACVPHGPGPMLDIRGAPRPGAARPEEFPMAAASVIVCPECDKKFKGREGLQGKKIKCPACGADSVVGSLIYDTVEPAQPKAPAKAAARTKPAAPKPAAAAPPEKKGSLLDGLDEDGNPYGVDTPDLAPRCPNCANELE